jgi:hypothetical protein
MGCGDRVVSELTPRVPAVTVASAYRECIRLRFQTRAGLLRGRRARLIKVPAWLLRRIGQL